MPLISVIIPVFNGEKTIRETIQSVLQQTFSDFELIVINGGSQDATLTIASSIHDPRLKIFSYPKAGAATNRNRGITHALGEYISFIDADDLWTPDKLEAQLQALQANPQATVAYSWTDCIDAAGNFLRLSSHATVSGNIYSTLLLTNILASGSNILVHKQALVEINGFNESFEQSVEDWELGVRLAARYQFAVVPKTQILYRVYHTSTSFNLQRLETMGLEAIEAVFANAPASLQYLKQPKTSNLYKMLVSKALQGPPERQKGLVAIKYLWKAFTNDASLARSHLTWKTLLKILTIVLLPSHLADELITRLNQRLGTAELLPLICNDPIQLRT